MKFAKFSGKDITLTNVCRLSAKVTKLCQIGFRLSGYVADVIHLESRVGIVLKRQSRLKNAGFDHFGRAEGSHVMVYFDRGKITEAYCTACGSDSAGGRCWCDHVLAVCIARIDQKNTCEIHLPLSDSLNKLSREQLLKFSQYLLCDHHLKSGIIESGQVLLNNLLKPSKSRSSNLGAGTADEGTTIQAVEDDLNSIPGAPDLTAGAGVEDKAHWFFCKESLQKKGVFGGYSNSLEKMGFLGLKKDVQQLDPKLLWSNGRNKEQGFVQDGLEPWIEKKDKQYRGEISTGDWMIINAVYGILKEEYGTATVAIGSWSDDVTSSFERIMEVKEQRKGFGYDSDRGYVRASVEPKPEKELCAHVEPLETFYSPRPFSWNESCHLAKMWRVAVLNPRLNKGNRDGMAHQLKERANKSSVDIGAVGVRKPWPGFTISIKLLQYDLYCPELRALCQGMVDLLPAVCVSSDEDRERSKMQTYVDKNVDDCSKSLEEKAEDDQMDATASQVKTEIKLQKTAEDNLYSVAAPFASNDLHEGSAKTSDLQLIPRWLKCGDLFCDVNTYIAVAEALEIYGQDVHATYLSCAVSFALLKFYYSCVGNKFQFSVSEKQSNQTRDNREIDAFTCFSPLSLPNVALLYRIISRKPDIVENWWLNLNKARKSSNGETSVQESISSPQSFVFQVGVMGFLTVRTPSATLDLEGDIFHHGKWLMHQLMESRPFDTDLTFLGHCVSAMLNIPSQLTFSISLSHLLFHHLFKECSQIESFQTLTTAQKSVMKSTISIFRSSIPHTQSIENQCFFLGVMWRKAASFAKEVLQVTATCSSLHERVCEALIQPSGLFGDPSLVRQGFRNSNTEDDYDMALFYWQRSIRGLSMALLPSLNEVEEQGTDRSDGKEERTRVLRKSQVSLLMHALLMHELQKQSKAANFSHNLYRQATSETRIIRETVWSNLLSVLQNGNFEENVKMLLDHPSYSVDVVFAEEVSQLCEELLKRRQSGSITEGGTIKDDDSSLRQTVLSVCISFLHCVKRWQEETEIPHKSKDVRECISDVCRAVRAIAAKDGVPDREHYVDNFLSVVLKTIERPEWMFLIVEELIAPFSPAFRKSNLSECAVRKACNQSCQLKKLLERCRTALDGILQGPEVNGKLQQVSQAKSFSTARQVWQKQKLIENVELSIGLTLGECLKLTKRVHLYLSDRGASSFRSLYKELEGRHPILSAIARVYIKD